MITIEELIELDYEIKTKLIKGGFDLIHSEKEYIISLSKEGTVTVIYPINSNKNSIEFNNYDDFLNFHQEN